MEEGGPASVGRYSLDAFQCGSWGKMCADIKHIFGISDKAERVKYIREHYKRYFSLADELDA